MVCVLSRSMSVQEFAMGVIVCCFFYECDVRIYLIFFFFRVLRFTARYLV